MSYLMNAWYMAGWSNELGATPLGRTYLGQAVVLFRDAQGTAHALADSCPHRFVPLSLGQVVDGTLECAYHGLRFGTDGVCQFSPQGAVPKGARVRSYPLIERHSMLWLWMGHEPADEELIPDFSCNDPAHNYVRGDYLKMENDYRFGVDNILDLSHIQFTHRNSLAPAFHGCSSQETGVRQAGNEIWSDRIYHDVPLSAARAASRRAVPGSIMDMWLKVRWNAPAAMLLHTGMVPAGGVQEDAMEGRHSHVFTPCTEDSCHYWYGVTRPRDTFTEEQAEVELNMLRLPFLNEDHPMLAAQQRAFGNRDFWEARPLILPEDAAAIRARRMLDKMIREESRTSA